MDRLKEIINFIQRYGDPDEETVVIPSFILATTFHNYDIGRLNIETVIIFSLTSVIFFGLWLGLASNRVGFIKIIIRITYIGVLTSFLYFILKNASGTEAEYGAEYYVRIATTTISTFGLLFYISWVLGTLVKEIAFLTEEEKRFGADRRRWLKYLMNCVIRRAKPLSARDGIIAFLVAALFTEIFRRLFNYLFSDYIENFPTILNYFTSW